MVMGYDMQTRLVYDTIKKVPSFRYELIAFRKKWISVDYFYTQIIIKGQPISDRVIRDLDLYH